MKDINNHIHENGNIFSFCRINENYHNLDILSFPYEITIVTDTKETFIF